VEGEEVSGDDVVDPALQVEGSPKERIPVEAKGLSLNNPRDWLTF
jgi:hypothetical protein